MPQKQKNSNKINHKNKEKTVRCPVDDCNKEVLSRGLHLHVLRSAGNGHGESMEIPTDVDLDDAEAVGERNVEMEYPEERDSEQVARLCPYCERPFRGKHGVMIHLGQVAGRKDHPKDATDQHEPDDFAIVRVDNNENVVDVVEEAKSMPSTERRRERDETDNSPDQDSIRKHIEELREQGLDEQADRAEKMLLSD